MKFVYDGTTWTCGVSEYPNWPVDLDEVTDSDHRRTWEGSGRKNTNWQKPVYGLHWDNVGSTVRDHVETWPDLDTAITFYSKYGTTECLASDYSASEVTLDNYNIGITLSGI